MAMQELAQKLYIGFYGRPADPEGLQHWTKRLEDGSEERSSLLEGFAYSEESQEFVFQNPTTKEAYEYPELVDNIYQNLFGRTADAAGRDWYVEQLEKGNMSLVSIVNNIMDGARDDEAPDATVLNNKLQVANQFTDMVDEEELEYASEDILDARAALEGQILNVEEAESRALQLIENMSSGEPDPVSDSDDFPFSVISETHTEDTSGHSMLYTNIREVLETPGAQVARIESGSKEIAYIHDSSNNQYLPVSEDNDTFVVDLQKDTEYRVKITPENPSEVLISASVYRPDGSWIIDGGEIGVMHDYIDGALYSSFFEAHEDGNHYIAVEGTELNMSSTTNESQEYAIELITSKSLAASSEDIYGQEIELQGVNDIEDNNLVDIF